MRSAHLWMALTIAIIGIIAVEVSATAAGNPSQPDDFWMKEFTVGVTGELAGGFMGLGILGAACSQFQNLCYPFDPLEFLQTGKTVDSPAFLMMNLGRAIGALTGVVIVGVIHGIEGNVLGAYMASGLWFVASSLFPLTAFPAVPAFVATVSYNWGAKMKSGRRQLAALSWHLPLADWKF